MIGNFCDTQFLDLNQTWNTQIPDFSSCFQDTVLVSLPFLLFSIILLVDLQQLPRQTQHSCLPRTWLNISKLCFSLSLLVISVIWCGIIIYDKSTGKFVPHSLLLSSSSRALAFLLITISALKHKLCGVTTSTALSVFWLFSSICGIFLYRSAILQYFVLNLHPTSRVIFVLNMIYYPVIFIELFLSVFADKKRFNVLHSGNIMDQVPFLPFISFTWFYTVIFKSRKKLLAVSDLSFVSVNLTADHCYASFSKFWKFYLLQGQIQNPSLALALVKSFLTYILATFSLNMLYLVCLMLPPLLLDRIIDFTHDDFYTWRGYFFTLLLFLIDFVGKMVQNAYIYCLSCSSIQFQTALMSSLFRKNLCLSTAARKSFDSGTVMNLLSVDVKRIQWFTIQSVAIFAAPLKIIVVIVIMWQYIGISTLAGVAVIFLLIPISYVISRYGEKFTDEQMKIKDIRLKHMNEILSGIKILKLYAWEVPFAAKVSEARKKEIKWIRYSLFCFVITAFVYFMAPFMVSFATFATFLFIDHNNVLSPTRAFVCLTLMDQLRSALFELPDAVSELIQCNISLGRLRKFFNAENADETAVGKNTEKDESITIKDASFLWTDDSECVLHDINLHVPQGKLIAVIGPVGSGKSSLLSCILGEMCKKSGSVDMKGSVAYLPQQPWVLNRSLKKNILLVKHFVEERYNEILDLCCLTPDLEILPAGDETEIGEKGVNLSGGQKLRVNLAQAVYQDKEIYLLDDPLSAVDVHVRKALFNNVIGNTGVLKDKTRILITHDVSVLNNVDMIVSMKDGRIDEIGSYEELLSYEGSFTAFIEEHANTNAEEEKSPPLEKSIMRLASHDSMTTKESQESGGGDLLLINDEVEFLDGKEKTHRLIEDEKMEIGGVHRKVYYKYVKRVGFLTFTVAVFWYIAYVSFEAGGNIWLSEWSSDSTHNGTHGTDRTVWRLSIYGALGISQVVCIALGLLLLVYGATKASRSFHDNMLESVIKSPMSFFDTTPMGRVINRFTTDMDTLDILMFYRVDGWVNCLCFILASFVVIGMNTPIFLAFLLPLGVIYYMIQACHLNTFRQAKRLESINRSPIYSLFMESIQGVSSIRAYNVEAEFIEDFEGKLDACFVCTHASYNCNRWLSFHLDTLGSTVILIATLSAIYNRSALGPAVVGLIVTYALAVTDSLKWFVRMNSELEDKSISVERIDEYCHLTPEAAWDLAHPDMQDDWPQSGSILFDNYSTRYREGLDLVLKEINLSVNAGEKVGIIGRTGAGKSSVTLALFRIIEPVSGTILIDNINIKKIGLHNLREKITIIPQDPVLFTGTLRMNLDPNSHYSDEEIWISLGKAYLKTFVSGLTEGLDYNLDESGSNLSAGQRQLVCLARALLKNTKILVLDEATASIDMDTDNLIQNTIRTAFSDYTIITIAHRLNTVLDYDKIVVMDSGTVVEVGSPASLLQNPTSMFYNMAKESGLA